MYTYTHATNK